MFVYFNLYFIFFFWNLEFQPNIAVKYRYNSLFLVFIQALDTFVNNRERNIKICARYYTFVVTVFDFSLFLALSVFFSFGALFQYKHITYTLKFSNVLVSSLVIFNKVVDPRIGWRGGYLRVKRYQICKGEKSGL